MSKSSKTIDGIQAYKKHRYLNGDDLWDNEVFNLYYQEWKKTQKSGLKNKLLLAHSLFLFSKAQEFHKRYSPDSLGVEDLFIIGWEGLENRINKYDPNKGAPFIKYAEYKVEAEMKKEIQKNYSIIRIPERVQIRLSKVRYYVESSKREGRGKPSNEELSEYMGINQEEAKDLLNLLDRKIISLNQKTKINSSNEFLGDSLEGFISSENSLTFIQDSYEAADSKIVLDSLFKLAKSKEKLTEKEIDVLKKRNAIDGNPKMSQEEIGYLYGITKSRIQQIEAKGMEKLSRTQEKLTKRGKF